MCAILIGVPGGKPLRFTTNVAVTAVMLPAESRVRSKVIVELPAPVDSAPLIGGFSFDAFRSAVNVGFGCDDADDGDESLLHADATNASARMARVKRFIVGVSLSQLCLLQQGRDQP